MQTRHLENAFSSARNGQGTPDISQFQAGTGIGEDLLRIMGMRVDQSLYPERHPPTSSNREFAHNDNFSGADSQPYELRDFTTQSFPPREDTQMAYCQVVKERWSHEFDKSTDRAGYNFGS
jgi:hypothetical protein